MKVSALFTDYDGTLAPADVTREDSAIPQPLLSVLEEISSMIPVAVITSKDLRFVKPRTAFAWGWATALGLEVRKRDGSGHLATVSGRLEEMMESVRETLPSQITVEEKRGGDGTLLGVSLDWTTWGSPSMDILDDAERVFRERGFQVDRYLGATYMDVYDAPADKGRALRDLARVLPARRPIMYLGDTEADNKAFEAADISVGVLHRPKAENLLCRYAIQYGDLKDALSDLLVHGLEFDGSSTRWGRGC